MSPLAIFGMFLTGAGVILIWIAQAGGSADLTFWGFGVFLAGVLSIIFGTMIHDRARRH